MNLPVKIAHPRPNSFSQKDRIVLAADIGGTKTNMALFRRVGLEFEQLFSHKYSSSEFPSPTEMVRDFKERAPQDFDAISLAIAGPVHKQYVQATNLPWAISARELKEALHMEEVYLLNDLEANAYGLAVTEADHFKVLYPGEPNPEGNVALISPGTGLGEAGLYWDGNALHPFATEGGHCDFAPQTKLDFEVLEYLQQDLDHVSWERLVSGHGIENIFNFFVQVKHMEVPDEVRAVPPKKMGPVISRLAAEGDSPICRETINLFLRYLAEESGNLILKYKATGGLFIGGGIVPDILEQLHLESFLHYLQNSGRMEGLLRRVPVVVIMNAKAAVYGAAFYGF